MKFSLRAVLLNPMHDVPQAEIEVTDQSSGEKGLVIVRAPTAGDYAAWRLALRRDAGIIDADDEETAKRKINEADLSRSTAQMVVRVMYERTGTGAKMRVDRVFSDDDIDELATKLTPLHEMVLDKALGLSGIASEDEAKKSSSESPTSDS